MVCQISCVWFVSHLGPPCTRPLAQAGAGIGPYHLSGTWALNHSHPLPQTVTTKPEIPELTPLDPIALYFCYHGKVFMHL